MFKLGRLSRDLSKPCSNLEVMRYLEAAGVVRPGVVRLARLFIAYFFVTHLVACCYWGIAKRSPVVCEDGVGGGVDGVLDAGGQFPWGVCQEVADERPWSWQYSVSFYWALLVMMGNESYPINGVDRLFTCATMLVGMVVNSIVIGSCASLLANLDKSAVRKQQQFDAINENLTYHKVSHTLAARVRSYYEYLWACGHHTNEDSLYRELPEKIRVQLAMIKKKPLIRGVDVFQNVSARCTVAIVEALAPVIMLPREYVMVQGQIGHEMFFINRGAVQLTRFINLRETPIRQLRDGGHFGETALLTSDRRRNASVVTLSFCDLQMLERKHFLRILREYDEFGDQVKVHAPQEGMTTQMAWACSRGRRVSRHGHQARCGADGAQLRPQLSTVQLAVQAARRKSVTLQKAARKSCNQVVSGAANVIRRSSTAPEPACCWTTESAGAQAVRKSADEVFEEAARCVGNTKRAAAALRRNASFKCSSRGGDEDSFERMSSSPQVRYMPAAATLEAAPVAAATPVSPFDSGWGSVHPEHYDGEGPGQLLESMPADCVVADIAAISRAHG